MQFLKTLGLIVLGFGCGRAGSNLSPDAESGLVGLWKGTYTDSLGLAAQRTYEVDLDLKKGGEFVLRHLALGNGASGSYSQLSDKKRILLNIRDSHIKAFRLDGSMYEFDYVKNGDRLELTSEKSSYLLSRQEVYTSTALDGQWYCSDEQVGFWRYHIQNNIFKMTHTNEDGVTYFLAGTILYQQAKEKNRIIAELAIEEALPFTSIPGLIIEVNKLGRGQKAQPMKSYLRVKSAEPQLEEVEPIECNKVDSVSNPDSSF